MRYPGRTDLFCLDNVGELHVSFSMGRRADGIGQEAEKMAAGRRVGWQDDCSQS